MLVSRLGEFALIERMKKFFPADSSVAAGIGDDCAALKFDKKNYLLFTSDTLVEGVDFSLRRDPAGLVGRKALAAVLSDIAACAGTPRYALVCAVLPGNFRLDLMDEICRGIAKIAAEYKVNIVGGDLSRGNKLTLCVSAIGVTRKKDLLLRSGAREGDIIFASGPLGGSIRGKHLSFSPRLREAAFLARNFKISAMIDISDGLAQDLGHILKQSQVGALLYADLIPLDKRSRGLADALYSGEDFELLFTLSRQQARRLIRNKKFVFYPIGEVVKRESGLRIIDAAGREKRLLAGGFRHF